MQLSPLEIMVISSAVMTIVFMVIGFFQIEYPRKEKTSFNPTLSEYPKPRKRRQVWAITLGTISWMLTLLGVLLLAYSRLTGK